MSGFHLRRTQNIKGQERSCLMVNQYWSSHLSASTSGNIRGMTSALDLPLSKDGSTVWDAGRRTGFRSSRSYQTLDPTPVLVSPSLLISCSSGLYQEPGREASERRTWAQRAGTALSLFPRTGFRSFRSYQTPDPFSSLPLSSSRPLAVLLALLTSHLRHFTIH